MADKYQEEYDDKCSKLQEVFDKQVQAFSVDDEDNDNENEENDDKTITNGNAETGEEEESPKKGPHLSTIIVNGASSPIKDGPESPETDNKVEGEGHADDKGVKVNSQEQLTNM